VNRKQRMQNRVTAKQLAEKCAPVCERCGERGYHYVHDPIPSIGGDCSGWLCEPKETQP